MIGPFVPQPGEVVVDSIGTACSVNRFTIQEDPDLYSGNYYTAMLNSGTNLIPVSLKDDCNGSFTAEYSIYLAGTYTLNILFLGRLFFTQEITFVAGNLRDEVSILTFSKDP
jgi:hypothetical protein